MIGTRRLDLPLAEDATGRFVVWIMAVMVYLGLVALAGAMVLAGMADRWESGLIGRLTVEVSPLPDEPGRGVGASSSEAVAPLVQRTELALALLRATPGVVGASLVTAATAHKLLEPWLGSALPDDLPLPALIDVEVSPEGGLAVSALADRLARSVPGARLDNHAAWLEDLHRLARSTQLVALAVVLLVGGAAVAAVVFAVRTGLALHSPVVELLHIMGATDSYVARQFQAHILGLAFRGGAIGLVLGITTLVLIARTAGQSAPGMLPAMVMTPAQWLALGTVPLIAAVLAALTARWTVMRVLAALP